MNLKDLEERAKNERSGPAGFLLIQDLIRYAKAARAAFVAQTDGAVDVDAEIEAHLKK